MRTCPKCNQEISRLKKGGCPKCETALFLSKGKYRRESDKELVKHIREIVKPAIERNLNCGGYLLMHDEWVYGYSIVDVLRAWLNSNADRAGLTTETLVLKTIQLILVDGYWKTHLKSLRQLTKQVITFAVRVLQQTKKDRKEQELQNRRIENANLNTINLNYSI